MSYAAMLMKTCIRHFSARRKSNERKRCLYESSSSPKERRLLFFTALALTFDPGLVLCEGLPPSCLGFFVDASNPPPPPSLFFLFSGFLKTIFPSLSSAFVSGRSAPGDLAVESSLIWWLSETEYIAAAFNYLCLGGPIEFIHTNNI